MRTYVFDRDMRLVVVLPDNAIIEVQDRAASVIRAENLKDAKQRARLKAHVNRPLKSRMRC